MNRLPIQERAQILGLMVEVTSLRATSRLADVSINTVTKLLVDVGAACEEYQDRTLRGLKCKRIQCDEIWAFIYAKAKEPPRTVPWRLWIWRCVDLDGPVRGHQAGADLGRGAAGWLGRPQVY